MLGLRLRSGVVRLLAAVAIALFGLSGLFADASLRPARAQETMAEFRETLGAYGRWIEHPRWGAVWVPAGIPVDWRPYRLGHWVYTDEWGWYWVADEEWGWIAYHYGRWVFDRDLGLGWIWVPGTEWSPAWVTWRQGEEAVGWAPMPPEEIYVSVRDEPDFWLFVRAPDIIAPSLAVVILPAPQAILYVRQTVIINQTVIIRQNNTVIVANPGVPPSFVAAKIGRPIQTVSVQPHVVTGTVGVSGAIVGAPPRGAPVREVIKPQPKLIQPAGRPTGVGQAPAGDLVPHARRGPEQPQAAERESADRTQVQPANRSRERSVWVSAQVQDGDPDAERQPAAGRQPTLAQAAASANRAGQCRPAGATVQTARKTHSTEPAAAEPAADPAAAASAAECDYPPAAAGAAIRPHATAAKRDRPSAPAAGAAIGTTAAAKRGRPPAPAAGAAIGTDATAAKRGRPPAPATAAAVGISAAAAAPAEVPDHQRATGLQVRGREPSLSSRPGPHSGHEPGSIMLAIRGHRSPLSRGRRYNCLSHQNSACRRAANTETGPRSALYAGSTKN